LSCLCNAVLLQRLSYLADIFTEAKRIYHSDVKLSQFSGHLKKLRPSYTKKSYGGYALRKMSQIVYWR
jgi:hypothetical protein